MVPVAIAHVHGLEQVEPYARFASRVPRVPCQFLWAIAKSARRHLPNEAMYQFSFDGSVDETGELTDEGWRCVNTTRATNPASLEFDDHAGAVIDLHSHGTLSAFFSETDDEDEQGLRFYAVIGQVDRDCPQIAVRVGVYGHTWNVPQTTVFNGGPFVQVDPEIEQVLKEWEDEKESIE
jgi:PRTRC genetic system protein A